MKYYEYEEGTGWLIGVYEAEVPRANATDCVPDFSNHRPMRWDGAAWQEDASRESQKETDDSATVAERKQAMDVLSNYDPATATASDVRATLGAVLVVLRQLLPDLKG